MGDFHEPEGRLDTHAARDSLAKTPCFLKRKLSSPIMGETIGSRRNHGLDGSAKNEIGPNGSRGDLQMTSQIAD